MIYTDEFLIQELQHFSSYLDKNPTQREVKQDELMPATSTYEKRFGSWNKALEAAGLNNNLKQHRKYTKIELVTLFKNLCTELKKVPTVRELNLDKSTPSASTYARYFGSYNSICALVVKGCYGKSKNISKENLALSYNKEWLSKENETKTLHEISNDLGYNKHRMSSRFKELDIKPILHKESLKEKEWLDSLGITERQYPIANYKVDGYDPETNTVYEFLGDYWHGNPEVYDPDEYNKSCSKTFGQLFDETNKRLEHIKSLGYNIITKWEDTQ